ncbi:MAG: hypothetical protein AAGL19_19765, partial [Pseudomonadota bacterium]
MKSSLSALVASVMALLTLSAQAQDTPTPATATELFDRFADTTQTLEDGLAYYAASGVLLVVRDGKMTPGKWVGHDDGRLCWALKETEESCESYVAFDNQIFLSKGGFIAGKPNLEAGNILAERASAQAFA